MAAYQWMENADGLLEPHEIADTPRPPHFPDPNADPVAIMEAIVAQKDEIIAAQYREMKGWQAQLEAALARLSSAEDYIARCEIVLSRFDVTLDRD